ncbi:MAG TPA: hypothetical protein VIK86_10055 [Candidatus Paceibacterota bacterium]
MNEEELKILKEKIYNKKENNHKSFTGIALKNVNVRLQLIYGEIYGLKINSKSGIGTFVEIVLPIHRAK